MKKAIFFVFVLGGFMSCAGVNQYPDHWWQKEEESTRAVWEILPQSANREKGEVILSKRNELGCLSNFAATPFVFRDKKYASMEGFWQMMKYPEGVDDPRNIAPGVKWDHTREEVAQMTGFDAHAAGVKAEKNMEILGIDWISFEGERMRFKSDPTDIQRHYDLIFGATKAKVEQNEEVKMVLLSTGGLKLLPDHFEDKDGTISWKYYDIHMKIREQIKKPL
ncbi:MAG: NADAR family protein [Oligoflexia bacterium]|nr:NADAR family protein [Oligoflexia bacterium]